MSQQTPPRPGSKRQQSAPLRMPQDVRKETAQADRSLEGRPSGANRKASKPSSVSAAGAKPLDPMTLMLPWIKSGVAYSTAAVGAQIKLYDMMMQMTPMGAIARQQAQIGNTMMQAMMKSAPLCKWGGKK